jgi:hypothetical protein
MAGSRGHQPAYQANGRLVPANGRLEPVDFRNEPLWILLHHDFDAGEIRNSSSID